MEGDSRNLRWKEKDRRQLNNLENNPCFKEQNMSFKCLDDNNYYRGKCEDYFQNYKNCKEFWYAVENHRKRNGIKPYLPGYEERKEIRAQYKKTGQI